MNLIYALIFTGKTLSATHQLSMNNQGREIKSVIIRVIRTVKIRCRKILK